MPTDIEIARQATLKPIAEVAAAAGVPDDALIPYGKYKAKIDRDALPKAGAQGKLIGTGAAARRSTCGTTCRR